jgi:formylglycine-generating enzyme required for sulfatase activity
MYVNGWGVSVDHAEAMRWYRKAADAGCAADVEIPLTSSVMMKFAWVPPGRRWLGGGDLTPGQQEFRVDKGFWCGTYLVTQAEWQAVMGDNPSHFKNKPRHPVENVSWNRVQQFLKTLNEKLRDRGVSFRLPTEQEWEYICRGGPCSSPDSHHFYFAISKTNLTWTASDSLSSKEANFDGNHPAGYSSKGKGPYLQATSEVGSYLPNPLGVYDLHGNVWEWTSTEEGSVRVSRGGSWNDHSGNCTASSRLKFAPAYAGSNLGFRLVAVPVGS